MLSVTFLLVRNGPFSNRQMSSALSLQNRKQNSLIHIVPQVVQIGSHNNNNNNNNNKYSNNKLVIFSQTPTHDP